MSTTLPAYSSIIGGPRAPVMRVSGMAYGAVAAQSGHAHGRAAAQHRQASPSSCLLSPFLAVFPPLVPCAGLRRPRQRVGHFHIRHA